MLIVQADVPVNMPPAIVIGAAGVIIGALFTLLTTLLNNRHQRRLARESNAHALALAQHTSGSAWEAEDRRHLRDCIEEAHQLLSSADLEFSMTTSTHTAQLDMSVPDWNARYAAALRKLRRLQMIADLYVPSISGVVGELIGQGSIFGWNQQTYLYQLSLGNPNASQYTGEKIAGASQNVGRLVTQAKGQLVEEAARLAQARRSTD